MNRTAPSLRMDHCLVKRSICTNSLIQPTAAIIEELLLLGGDSVVKTGGVGTAAGPSCGVGRAGAPLFDDASAECNVDLEDIVFYLQFVSDVSLLKQG